MNLVFRLSPKGGFSSFNDVTKYFSDTLINENEFCFFDTGERRELNAGDSIYYLFKSVLIAKAIFNGDIKHDKKRNKKFTVGHKLSEIKTYQSSEKIDHFIFSNRTCYVRTQKMQSEIDRLLNLSKLKGNVSDKKDGDLYPEGKEKYKIHKSKERNGSAPIDAKKERLAKTGKLECEVCSTDFKAVYGDLGFGFIEAHHTIPVSKMPPNHKTKISELALVCSNCHKMLHRGESLLSIDALKDIIKI
ncbi:HNH endonuclease [Colwellia piezophila]|uniref:HNH endonuclease n=1 Tax=Colwellia piezophila TaxID=211668 RepID=UPI00039C05EC|nr:HNH endonuclease [Colwellia piezophila]